MQPFLASNDLLDNPQALRERSGRDGYLFFRGLLDPDKLTEVRRQILEICAQHGWTEPGTDPVDGIAAPGVVHVEGQPHFNQVYRGEIMCLEVFHALAHEPALLEIFETLFQEEVLVHPRNIARIIFPQAKQFTTPPHQDFIHIQGTEDTWTSWIPLASCPEELGGLAVLAGSHKDGLFEVKPMLGAGGLGIETEAMPHQWVYSVFEPGDVVLFHSLTVHKGLPNRSEDKMRISVDFRYQGVSEPIVGASLLPHGSVIPWEQVYSEWESPEFQYYWSEKPLQVVEYRSKDAFKMVSTY